ncbi:hypothetical protein KY290_027091 [Solanum tuberosum]|uniref:Uncharacterized protein n=1 Tax=Solanum tuberosum TaxID=4113 RepID=A0ABQ7UEL9_SOLTU|nr:hypothetical protein KY284_026054 [Solanum tuberosum]KAH0747859.1 hypothetical protein KY290_027091 [Solanum tuberosum]
MAHYHDYGVLMQQQVANMTQSQQPLQHEALMMQQKMVFVPLQHQTASMTQYNEGEIQEQEAQNQEDIADVPQLQLQVHICVSSKCNEVIHQIKTLLSVQFPKEQFLHQWKNIPYQVERFMPKINIKCLRSIFLKIIGYGPLLQR